MKLTTSRSALCATVAWAAIAHASPAAAQERTFDIPSQDWPAAISAFGRQSGLQIVAPGDVPSSVRVNPVKGVMDAKAALRTLIAGTGLEVASDNGNVIVLRLASGKSTTSALAEVIVTAQKRSENAQNVPITLTAFGAEDLEKRNIDDVRDLAKFTPGFNAAQFSYDKPVFAIRGAENTFSAAGATKPVGVFVDEIYVPRFSASNFSLFDVESVSVLKGPQGTLFGRNVTAGAVVVQTRDPSLDGLRANARAGVGNYGLYEFSGYLSGPVSDSIAGSISIDRQVREGYGKDILNGKDEDDADSWSSRVGLLYKPTDAFKLRLSVDYSHDENGGRALSATTNSDADRRTSALGIRQTFDRDIAGGSARMEFVDGPVTLTSLTGYRYSNTFEIFSRTGLSYPALTSNFQEIGEERERDSAFSQELRLNYEDQRFNLVTGVFYFQEDSERGFRKYRLAARTGATSLDNFYDQDVKTTSAAPFADATWHVTDRFDLTGGLRYTYEHKDARMALTVKTAPATGFAGTADRDWSQMTYRGVATYRPTDDVTIYGSYATGFTAGGYNTEADLLVAFKTPFDPETSASFELGVKTRFADGRGRFNIAAFSTKYKDKQEFIFNNLTFVGNILNSTEATARGVEAEVAFTPYSALTLSATLAYLDTEYGQFLIPGSPSQTGNKLGSSPRLTYSVSADLNQPVSWGRVLGNVSYAHKDTYFPSATNLLPIPQTNLLDAQIGVGTEDDRWRLMLWGRNLTDHEVPLIRTNFVVDAEWLAPPRTYGVRVSYKY